MNEEDAIVRFARTLGMSSGDIYFVQTEGQIGNPHAHRRGDSGMIWIHTDGWAVRNDGFTYSIAKIHSDDFERGATPSWHTYYG
jgi:hypothetical protein